MRRFFKAIGIIIVLNFMTAAVSLSAYAAGDKPEPLGISRGVIALLCIVLFTVVFAISGIVTFKYKMKKLREKTEKEHFGKHGGNGHDI